MNKVYFQIIEHDNCSLSEERNGNDTFEDNGRTIGFVTDEDVAKEICASDLRYGYITHRFEV